MNMNVSQTVIDKLESSFIELIHGTDEIKMSIINKSILEGIKTNLNNLFETLGDDKDKNNVPTCLDVLYTVNTDKPFFGVKVDPCLSMLDIYKIFTDEERMKINQYKLEFDSKIVKNCNLTAKELMAYTLFEISNMFTYGVIDNIRTIIDMNLAKDDDYLSIRDSIDYSRFASFAIKDTMYKLSSIIYNNEEAVLRENVVISTFELGDDLIAGAHKVVMSEYGPSEMFETPNISVLKWYASVYRDIKSNANIIIETLKNARDITASKLAQDDIDLTIKSIDKISTSITENCDLNKYFDNNGLSKLNEVSLFKSLKKSGLRSLEDNLYEIKLQIKNLETEEDALYVMRSINTRLNILMDYIYNTEGLSEKEIQHWEYVAGQYRAAREELIKKKIWNKKQYGIFIDYDQLDQEN